MDYIYIRAWESRIGRSDNYIEAQLALAREMRAPDNAIWIEPTGKWYTVDDIMNADVRSDVEKIATQLADGCVGESISLGMDDVKAIIANKYKVPQSDVAVHKLVGGGFRIVVNKHNGQAA